MKHTFKHEGVTTSVQPYISPETNRPFVCLHSIDDFTGVALQFVLIPPDLAGVIAQAIELTGESLMNTDKPLINAQTLEAAKSFGEGLPV